MEKYFVCGCGDAPYKIMFDLTLAQNEEHEYIDSFDEDGEKVGSYKFDFKENKYTTDF